VSLDREIQRPPIQKCFRIARLEGVLSCKQLKSGPITARAPTASGVRVQTL